jgi:hypothetical protein
LRDDGYIWDKKKKFMNALKYFHHSK